MGELITGGQDGRRLESGLQRAEGIGCIHRPGRLTPANSELPLVQATQRQTPSSWSSASSARAKLVSGPACGNSYTVRKRPIARFAAGLSHFRSDTEPSSSFCAHHNQPGSLGVQALRGSFRADAGDLNGTASARTRTLPCRRYPASSWYLAAAAVSAEVGQVLVETINPPASMVAMRGTMTREPVRGCRPVPSAGRSRRDAAGPLRGKDDILNGRRPSHAGTCSGPSP